MPDNSEKNGSHIEISAGDTRTSKYISNGHLKSADFFVEQAKCIENQYEDRDALPKSGCMSYHAYLAYCTSAIIDTMAFLEATFNEIASKMIDRGEQSYPQIRNKRFWRVIDSNVTDEIFGRKPSTIKKYNNMLSIADKNEISTGKDPGQSAECLRELRNAFVHYEPKSVRIVDKGQTDGEYGFETGLQGRFELNPYTGDGNSFFPDQCQSRGCAEWCVKSSLSFSDEFFGRMGIDRPYEPMLDFMDIDQP